MSEELERRTEEDIAGVQGDDEAAPAADQAPAPGETPDAPAPDAGEIEWAGGAVTKPPRPAA